MVGALGKSFLFIISISLDSSLFARWIVEFMSQYDNKLSRSVYVLSIQMSNTLKLDEHMVNIIQF